MKMRTDFVILVCEEAVSTIVELHSNRFVLAFQLNSIS